MYCKNFVILIFATALNLTLLNSYGFFSGDVDGADKSQRDLAIGYPSQCAGWIVVLKRLINESRAALPSTDDGSAVPNAEPTGFMVPLPKE